MKKTLVLHLLKVQRREFSAQSDEFLTRANGAIDAHKSKLTGKYEALKEAARQIRVLEALIK